ncbi:MAG: hypothetical protein B7Y89_11030 [Novosphingobium sp. 32-60-15]|nr:MAG: hypothetical protein B7Y89_11030 [Novosphingobium sp. 32-60-15]
MKFKRATSADNISSSLRGGEADEAIQSLRVPLWIASPRFAGLAMTKVGRETKVGGAVFGAKVLVV